MKSTYFEPAVSEIIEYAKKKEAQLRGSTPGTDAYRRWMLYRTFLKGTVTYGSGVLDRTDINQRILEIYTKGGKQGELTSITYQMQILQAIERALIHRKMTPVRALAHLTVRYSSHGSDNGIFAYLKNQIDELEAAMVQ